MKFLLAPVLLLTINGFSQSKETLTVYFEFDKYHLTPSARASIDSLISQTAGEKQAIRFEVVGHCDSRGSNEYNEKLSERRATTVRNYLLQKGFAEGNFSKVDGQGEEQPLNDNLSDADRQLNRRVQIIFNRNAKETVVNSKSLSETIADSSTTVGTNIVLKNLNFVGGRHHILPESSPILQELLKAMIDNPKLVIRIEGHICCVPDDSDGPDLETGLNNLSEARAAAIYQYLVNNGIDSKRLSYHGYGHSKPLFPYPEKDEEEMKLNRRVEIRIVSR